MNTFVLPMHDYPDCAMERSYDAYLLLVARSGNRHCERDPYVFIHLMLGDWVRVLFSGIGLVTYSDPRYLPEYTAKLGRIC